MENDSMLQKRYNHFHYIVLQSIQRGLDEVASGLIINQSAAINQLLPVLEDNISLNSLAPEE